MPKERRVALMLELDWPYKRHTGVLSGALQYAREQGWHVFIDEYVDHTLHARQNEPLCYDGVIARATRKLALCTGRLSLPLVNVWRNSPAWKSLPGVYPDFSTIGRLRAEHLLSRGLSNFSTLTNNNEMDEDDEIKAFASYLREAGHACTSVKLPVSDETLETWLKIERTIEKWMDDFVFPVGVYVESEIDGRTVAQMCSNRGLRVPEDVAIIAGQNEEPYCEGIRPTLSSVDLNFERVGYEAAKLLGRMMDGQKPPNEPILIPPKGMVVRESTDFYAVKDTVISTTLKFIAENAHKAIDQKDVARAMATELRTLQLRFVKYLNRTITAEIRRVRIERAKRELVQGDRRLKQIALDTGFGELKRMCRTFRRELGLTPIQYRKQRLIKK